MLKSEKNKDVAYGRVSYWGEYTLDGKKRKGNKKQDFCCFCETYVLNFARHILRNHSIEKDVQRISSFSPKNKERKKILSNLRKKGNFLNSSTKVKPTRNGNSNNKLLPCSNCLGYYSSKQLWRHRKNCMDVNDKLHQAQGQNILLKNLRVDTQLRKEVFPKMRPDDISLVAKTDELICAFGARYYKCHREKHFINVTSRKMRELARLFIEVKKIKPSVKNLFDALRPDYFGILVTATKVVAQYDHEKEFFQSASTALSLGTAIKQCCQLAIVFVLKRKEVYSTISAAESEANLKTLSQLIDSEWRFEISTKASTDLNTKKWNKITLVPLATDLKLLKDFLISKAKTSIEELKVNSSNQNAYITLLETVYCRVLLLNRRRPGELQRFPLHLYQRSEDHFESYEEFSDMISASEKILLRKFKRIVIRGKRARGVPVLFSTDIQEHINILLQHRDQFFSKNNLYLFGNPNTIQPICGYKVISRYAKLCGAKNPHAITATRLRKHLATLTQVLSMSDNDIEQLSLFMGHTVNIHKGSYRLPDDLFQTAKMSKLLLLMEKGEAAQYKGKNLDQIDIDLDIDVNDLDSDDDDEVENFDLSEDLKTAVELAVPGTSKEATSTLLSKTDSKKSGDNLKEKGKRELVPWNAKQKSVVLDFFKNNIKNSIPPKKGECLVLKEKFPDILENKNWLKIKVFIQNQYVKRKVKQ
jgi:hypothetical protein